MRRRVLIFALSFLLAPVIVFAGNTTVVFRPEGDIRCSGAALVQEAAGAREITFSTENELTLSAERPARLSFRGERCWIAPIEIAAEVDRIEARVWPAATVRAKVSVPPREQPPAALGLKISVDGRAAASPCSLHDDVWRCTVPSTPVDLRIATDPEDYAPHYRRGLHLKPGEEFDLGLLELRRGASLTGSIEMDGLDDATIELRPEGFQTAETGENAAIRVRPSRDGFFQFTGIAPGTYEIQARALHRSPARRKAIAVTEAREYLLDPVLRLEPLVPVRVLIAPPADALQRPWTISLERTEARSTIVEPVVQQPADPTGWWDGDPIPGGTYVLTVLDAAGAKVHSERWDVTPPAATLTVRLDLIPVRGSVRAGAKSFPAKLVFHQTGGRSVTMDTDGDARFAGLLPSEGKWNVRVMSPDRRFYIAKRDVEVARRGDDTAAVIDLVLPAGKIRGKVVDDQGEPVEADVVVYRNGQPEADAATNAAGTFELLGVETGLVSLRAVTRGAESGLVPHDVTEVANTGVHLVVRRLRSLSGWLTTADSQPIAGALVRYASPTIAGLGETTTGPSGELTLKVPADTTTVTFASLVPGMPVSVQSVATGDERKFRLIAGRTAGRLVVRMTRRMPLPLLLAPGSVPFPLGALVFPPDGSGKPPRGLRPDGFAIDLEPASYRLCDQQLRKCLAADLAGGGETIVDAESLQ